MQNRANTSMLDLIGDSNGDSKKPELVLSDMFLFRKGPYYGVNPFIRTECELRYNAVTLANVENPTETFVCTTGFVRVLDMVG